MNKFYFIALVFCLSMQNFSASITSEVGSFLSPAMKSKGNAKEVSNVEIGTEYSHLLSFNKSDSSAFCNFERFTTPIFVSYAKENYGFYSSLMGTRSDVQFRIPIKSGHGTLSQELPASHVELGGWFRSSLEKVRFVFTIGRHFIKDSLVDSEYYMHEGFPLTSLMQDMRNSLSCKTSYRGGLFFTDFEIARDVMALLPVRMTSSSGRFVNITSMLIDKKLILRIGLRDKDENVYISWTKRTFDYGDIFESKNALPLNSAFLLNCISLHGELPNDTISVEVGFAKGYINGYDGEKENASRFVIFNNLFGKRTRIDYCHRISENILFRADGELSAAYSPNYLYADMYPFSSWAIIRPTKYRMSEPNMWYRHGGVSFEFSKKWSNTHRTDFAITPAYHRMYANILTERLELVGLLPIYTNDTYHNFLNHRVLTTDIGLKHSVAVKRVTTTLSASQIIPIFIKEVKDEDGDTGGDSGSSGSSKTERTFGGFNAGISVTFAI